MQSISTGSNGNIPQVVSAPSDFNANILVTAMDGDGKFSSSRFTAQGRLWSTNKPVSFVNQNGSTTSLKPRTALSSIAMSCNHYFYGVTEDGTDIIEYTWTSASPYTFNWASNVVTT